MKNQKTINLNGKDLKLKFTLGVLEDFQEFAGTSDIDSALSEMKNIRYFLYLMAKYAGEQVEPDDLKYLDLEEMGKAMEVIGSPSGKIKAGAQP